MTRLAQVLLIAAVPTLHPGLLRTVPPPGTTPPGAAASQSADEPERFVAAARQGDENAVRRALDETPELLDAKDAMGLTALDWAATRAHWPIVRQLLDAGAEIGGTGFDGGTVLHRLAHHEKPDFMQELLDLGADIGAQNQWGRTPLHVAYGSGQPEMVRLLLAAGADPEATDDEGRIPADHLFQRPPRTEAPNQDLREYQGHYRVSDEFAFAVRVQDGTLKLTDFAVTELYPTGPDAFFSTSEPWAVRFSRSAEGRVTDMEVQFLRRAERGTRLDYPEYVGSARCGECHTTGEGGAPFVTWLQSRHAGAYWRLATDWARFLASQRPHFQDLTDPRTDSRCLNCHTTAALDEAALFAASFDLTQGVGCEACHGPGSKYANRATMRDREAFLAAGGRIPGEEVCVGCHRNPDAFSFEDWWPRIAHGS